MTNKRGRVGHESTLKATLIRRVSTDYLIVPSPSSSFLLPLSCQSFPLPNGSTTLFFLTISIFLHFFSLLLHLTPPTLHAFPTPSHYLSSHIHCPLMGHPSPRLVSACTLKVEAGNSIIFLTMLEKQHLQYSIFRKFIKEKKKQRITIT